MERLELRVTVVEKKVDEVCDDIKTVMRNHLPHIQAELEGIKAQMRMWAWILGLIFSGVVGLVIDAIVTK